MQQCWVFAVATSRLHAEQVVERLRAGGVSAGDVSVLVPVPATGASARPLGTVLSIAKSGPLGWLRSLVELPCALGLPAIAGGPLGDLLDAAGTGGLLPALESLNVVEGDARRLLARVEDGQVLLAVRTASPTRFVLTCDLFRRAGATDLAVAQPAERPSPAGRQTAFALPRFA